MATLRDKVLDKARSQLGVRYWSMHSGPKGSASEGWGCAMLAAWCLNEVLGTDYYGSCWNFWGDAIGAPLYNQGGGEFEVTDSPEAGDLVIYFKPDVNIGYSTSASHTAVYIGNGRVIGAMGHDEPGDPTYLNIGIKETTVDGQSLGGVIRYIRCKRLNAPTTNTEVEVFPLNATVIVQSPTLNVRSAPVIKDSTLVKSVQYVKGDKVYIDALTLGDGYVWGHYIGGSSGKDRYIALGTLELAR